MIRSLPPLANTIVLGVRDFAAQRAFYQRLGWPQIIDLETFTAFELRGIVLALFPNDQLALDAGATSTAWYGGIRSSIIITVDHPEDVDELTARVREAGGIVTKEPVEAQFFEGRSAYFKDPEDNYWEIAWAAPVNSVADAARRAASGGTPP
jgi:uncharacterized protein